MTWKDNNICYLSIQNTAWFVNGCKMYWHDWVEVAVEVTRAINEMWSVYIRSDKASVPRRVIMMIIIIKHYYYDY